jgi:hypothetical protein
LRGKRGPLIAVVATCILAAAACGGSAGGTGSSAVPSHRSRAAIGLKVVLRSVPAQEYIEFAVDPKFRAGVDGFAAVTYGDYAGPEALLAQAVLPGGLQNYDNYRPN